jgi:hypothetical protein
VRVTDISGRTGVTARFIELWTERFERAG